MKTILPFYLLLLLSFLAGCATTQPDPAKVAAARQTIDRVTPYIRAVAAVATRTALVYAERDSGRRAELTGQIRAVAVALHALLDAKTFDPARVTAALKVKESYVDALLASVGEVYAVAHDDLDRNGQAGLVVELLRALTSGVESATD